MENVFILLISGLILVLIVFLIMFMLSTNTIIKTLIEQIQILKNELNQSKTQNTNENLELSKKLDNINATLVNNNKEIVATLNEVTKLEF